MVMTDDVAEAQRGARIERVQPRSGWATVNAAHEREEQAASEMVAAVGQHVAEAQRLADDQRAERYIDLLRRRQDVYNPLRNNAPYYGDDDIDLLRSILDEARVALSTAQADLALAREEIARLTCELDVYKSGENVSEKLAEMTARLTALPSADAIDMIPSAEDRAKAVEPNEVFDDGTHFWSGRVWRADAIALQERAYRDGRAAERAAIVKMLREQQDDLSQMMALACETYVKGATTGARVGVTVGYVNVLSFSIDMRFALRALTDHIASERTTP